MQLLIYLLQIHFMGTHMQSALLPIHQMDLILSLALWTRLSGFGMQSLDSVFQAHLRDTQVLSCLLSTHLMEPTSSLALETKPSGCGI